MHSEKLLYTKREAAALLSLSVRTIDNLIANKELQVRRVGRRALIPQSTLQTFVRHDHPTEPMPSEPDQEKQ